MLGLNSFAVTHFAFVDPDGKAAVRIGASPGLILNRCAVLSVIRQRDQKPVIALLAFWQVHLHSSLHNATSISSPAKSLINRIA